MNVSVERLRVWLLAGAALLVLVIAGFLGYAHYRAHRFLSNLPKKLGIDIRRETNGYTLSQSIKGRTVYTIHAAKAVERSNGKITLHDVGIVLYGRQQDRADRIYGNEFEYDQKAEVIRAVGEVHIDLQAPQAADASARMDYAAGKDLPGDPHSASQEKKDPKLIHVTTSGLVFLRKLGVAATDNDIQFESGGLSGHAVGADYNSDSGIIVLHSDVKVNGLRDGRPMVLTASRAELDRPDQTILLTQANYTSVGGPAGEQKAQGQHVVVHLRKDGSAERVEAEGNVILGNGEGTKLAGPRGEVRLSAQNQPQTAVMSGGVRYTASEPLRQTQAEAAEVHAAFDSQSRPAHVVMTGAVRFDESAQASSGAAQSKRELNANRLELALSSDATGKAHLRDAKATDNARLKVLTPVPKQGTTATTGSDLSGDVLTAHFVQIGNADHISEVHDDGHAVLRRTDAKGVMNTTSSDSLVARFHAVTASQEHALHGNAKVDQQPDQGSDAITDAVAQGHVVLTQLPPSGKGQAAKPESRANAERAEYDGTLERTTLTGNVQVDDGTSILRADRVVSEQQSGDATADGSVKASYGQPGSTAEPVHVLASRAEIRHASQVAIFYGEPTRPARLWQAASQVEAPVLHFDQKQKTLHAHGAGKGAPMAVHTVLVSNARPEDSAAAKTPKNTAKTNIIRIQSRDLAYSDPARRADFTGGVKVESSDGTMRAQQAEVYLEAAGAQKSTAKPSGKENASQSFMAGSVERVVANGPIEIEQPGRHATGQQLVYTANDGMFVLTGTPAVPPIVVDAERGTITGASLRFHAADQNIVVSKEGESGAGHRVRTETRVKNRQ